MVKGEVSNARFRDSHSNHCSEEVEQFAITSHYYSPKAYDFVCKVLLLSHPASIRTWAALVDCKAGLFCDMIKVIGHMM